MTYKIAEEVMNFEKSTKNKHRFYSEKEASPLGTIYINKDAFGGFPPKGKIKITVEEIDCIERDNFSITLYDSAQPSS